MATSDGSQRKKRAWRKPREEIGPGTIDLAARESGSAPTASNRIPKRINRTGMGTSKTSHECKGPQSNEPMDTSSKYQETSEQYLIQEGVSVAMPVKSKEESSRVESVAAAEDTSRWSGTDSDAPLVIDGSVLEGGGQILRNAMALSCLLCRPISITRIRAGRGNSGLRPQHLTGIELLSEMCRGKLVGGGIGSSNITFSPQAIEGGEFTADTHTAGSVCLLLQAALPCLLFAAKGSKVTLKGGTNADMAPPIDYTMKVFQPVASRFGVQFDCSLVRRGFYPKGRGEVNIAIPTGPIKHLSAVTMTDPGLPVKIKIHAYVAGAVPMKMSHQMVHAARKVLDRQLPGVAIDVEEIQETRTTAFGNSSGIIAIAETSTGCLFAGSANGRKSDLPEKTGKTAVDELVRNVRAGGCVDEHLQDQLIILMALAKGTSIVRTGPITLHTQTAIHIAQLMTQAKFKIEKVKGEKGDVNLIHCEGIGLENKQSD